MFWFPYSVCLKYFSYFYDFNETWIFPTYFGKIPISNLMKIRPLRAELFHAAWRTDGHSETNSFFFLEILRTRLQTIHCTWSSGDIALRMYSFGIKCEWVTSSELWPCYFSNEMSRMEMYKILTDVMTKRKPVVSANNWTLVTHRARRHSLLRVWLIEPVGLKASLLTTINWIAGPSTVLI